MRAAIAGIVLAAAAAGAAWPADLAAQDQDSWTQAFSDAGNAAPRYVMATIVDGGGASRTGCLLAREFTAAVALDGGSAAKLAASQDHVVRLASPAALDAVKAISTPADAASLAQDFTIPSRAAVLEKRAGGWLPDQGPNLPAFACLLIGYGFSPYLDGGVVGF